MKAYSLIRQKPWYRKEAFASGLAKAGFDVVENYPQMAKPGDLLLSWNRYGNNATVCDKFEREGGLTLIAENGYLNADGSAPKFAVHNSQGPRPTDFYAIGIGFHNDAQRVKAGGPERWAAMGIELKPWRVEGSHILVCPNRSFGVPERVMRADWADRCATRLRAQTKREVRIRRHPGNDAPARTLSEDLKGCWAVYVWSSSVAVHALVAGIPTFIEAPYQIMKGAGAKGSVDGPEVPERLEHFEHLAWGQWRCAEIESGAPFRHLLSA